MQYNKIKVFLVMIQFVIVYTVAYPSVAGLDLSTSHHPPDSLMLHPFLFVSVFFSSVDPGFL